MNPLFQNYGKAQEEARQAFRRTELGKLLTSSKPPSPRQLSRFAGAIRGFTSSRERYGRFSDAIKRMVFQQLTRSLGPFGELVSALIRPTGMALASITQELDAAAQLLNAFGYDVKPPQSPRGTFGPFASADDIRDLIDDDLADAIEVTSQKPAYKPRPELAPRPQLVQGGTPPSQPPRPPRIGGSGAFDPNDPIMTGEMVEVQSSNVHSIGYDWNARDPRHGTLKVRFLKPPAKGSGGVRQGKGSLYHYINVPPEVFQAFRAAASKGKFVWDRLRIRGSVSGHQYYYWLAAIRDGYVPRQARQVGGEEWFLRRNVQGENGQVYSSSLGDERVNAAQFLDRVGGRAIPQRGQPNRGQPSRGTPNRGRQPGFGDHAALN